MPFRPHSLPYKLRALFDAKVCSPQDLARSTGLSLRSIDNILRGGKPDAVTRLQIDKALSYYTRLRNRHLKLEEIPPEEQFAEIPSTEGVFEELDAAAGQIELKVRDGLGGRMALMQFRADTVDDELLDDLERWHARQNPTHLQLSDESSAQIS